MYSQTLNAFWSFIPNKVATCSDHVHWSGSVKKANVKLKNKLHKAYVTNGAPEATLYLSEFNKNLLFRFC